MLPEAAENILSHMRIVFIGDIVGRPGRAALSRLMPAVVERYRPELIIANGENAAAGFGITQKVAHTLFKSGIDVITSGNHIWDRREMETEGWLDEQERLLRPANYPPETPGKGWAVIEKNDRKIAVINLQGRIMMPPTDCPFRKMEAILDELPEIDAVVVDFHAEATSEKEAFARYFDGKVAAVVGTHTHVQTADEKILPKGTAFICDVGMTGGAGGVIGFRMNESITRFLKGTPGKLKPEKADPAIMGVFIQIENNGLAASIERFQIRP